MAVYLTRVGTNAAVWLNGELVGTGGSMEPPIDNNWNRPLWFAIGPSTLREGENVLEVRIVQYLISPPYLAPVAVGPVESLRPSYERRMLAQIEAPGVGVLASLLLACALLAVSRRRSRRSGWRWAAAALFSWALGTYSAIATRPPALWESSGVVATCLAPVLLIFAAHRSRGVYRLRTEGLLLAAMAVLTAGLIWLPPFWWFYWQAGWHLIFATSAVYLVVLLVPILKLRPIRTRAIPVLAVALISFGIIVHDVVALSRIRDQDQVLLSSLLPLILVFGFAWMLMIELTDSLTQSERLNAELEERVRRKQLDLEQSYARSRVLEKDAAVAEERERIMRDMHDGMGGQLVSALALVQTGSPTDQVEDALHDALDEMRVVIDSLDPEAGDLAELLAMLRSRFEPRLAREGLRLRWQVTDIPSLSWFGPEDVLDVARIVQECLTNVLKHAEASEVTISTAMEQCEGGECVVIEMVDDGRGAEHTETGGRGLANMERRATRLGGELRFSTGPSGSRVRLSLPTRRA